MERVKSKEELEFDAICAEYFERFDDVFPNAELPNHTLAEWTQMMRECIAADKPYVSDIPEDAA